MTEHNRAKNQSHRCQKYANARGEIIDPAAQSGIGCPVCEARDGYERAKATGGMYEEAAWKNALDAASKGKQA
jgi:hypothetical protein